MRSRCLLLLCLTTTAGVAVARAQQSVPPLSYVCPMPQDADVLQDKPGTCPRCGMRLMPVRLASVWTCPIHAAVIKDASGTCPIDGRHLIQVTMAESWSCPGDTQRFMEPGRCPDGTPRKATLAPRPHGNHNPQHGGEFFMASDNWHHLEGTYPRAGVFRLYLYDDYTKPLPIDKLTTISGRLTTDDGRDIALKRNGRVLEARFGPAHLPVSLHAHVKFDPSGSENLFDFTFPTYTTEARGSVVVTKTTTSAPAVRPAPMGTPTPSGIKLGLSASEIPTELPALLKGLRDRSNQIRSLIQQGQYGTVYVPAFEAKDLALSVEVKDAGASSSQRAIIDTAVSQVVRDTYLLDAYGDLGNQQRISSAYADFAAAVDIIANAFPQASK